MGRTLLMAVVGVACAAGAALAAMLARPPANPDVLEPSIENEVEHALSSASASPAETNRAMVAAYRDFMTLYATNGMNATERAISLVSSQKDGQWLWKGTNVTPAAVRILRRLAGPTNENGDSPR